MAIAIKMEFCEKVEVIWMNDGVMSIVLALEDDG